jgi:hypothetical protein
MLLSNPFNKPIYPTFYNNDYSFTIQGGKHKHNRYFEMKHGQKYSVLLNNNTNTSCRATLKIDGEYMGNFFISAYYSININRPAHSSKIFTFYKINRINPSSYHSGIIPGNPMNGLVEVTFVPSKSYIYNSYNNLIMSAPLCNYGSYEYYSEGGTGLSGHSHQKFVDAGIMDLDFSRKVTLSYRLVGSNHCFYNYDDIYPIHFKQRRPPHVNRSYSSVITPICPVYTERNDGYVDPLLYK